MVVLSRLKLYVFKHDIRNALNPICTMSEGIEDTEYCLQLCRFFDIQRQNHLAETADLIRPSMNITELSNDALMYLLQLIYDFMRSAQTI